ncbi:MAG: lysophospholipid acyltransferase family protein [Planctomycetota bacterium]
MSMPLTLALVIAGWLALVGLFRLTIQRWLASGPSGDATTGFLWLIVRTYGRLVHRTTYTGLEHIPPSNRPGGLVVVCNHTGPIDPLLVQAACRFEIRWMMASDMMVPELDWLWRRQRMIPVARDGRDTVPAREAIRHVRSGGVIGIFPEGGIVLPREEVRQFHQGVGLIIARTEAPVLLVWVSQTPHETSMGRALVTPSRARVQFVDVLEFPGKTDPATITRQLQQRLAEASNWPIKDEPLIPPQVNGDPFALA